MSIHETSPQFRSFVEPPGCFPGGFAVGRPGIFQGPADSSFYRECIQDIGGECRWRAGKGVIYFRIISLMSPMALRSLNLPGVGTKYEFETDKGDTVAIFFTKTGTIQMYTLQKGCHTPSAAEMTPVEARRLGNILTGAIIEADQESVEIAFSALADLRVTIHTYIVPRAVSGKTIEDLEIRAKTGTTVIAVSRNDKNIINPPPSFVFETGDAVLVIGETDQLRLFEHEIMVD
jgi:TrkA domain protein